MKILKFPILYCLYMSHFICSIRVNIKNTLLDPHELYLPLVLPQIIQDPQTLPHDDLIAFGFDTNGALHVDLSIEQSQPDLMPSNQSDKKSYSRLSFPYSFDSSIYDWIQIKKIYTRLKIFFQPKSRHAIISSFLKHMQSSKDEHQRYKEHDKEVAKINGTASKLQPYLLVLRLETFTEILQRLWELQHSSQVSSPWKGVKYLMLHEFMPSTLRVPLPEDARIKLNYFIQEAGEYIILIFNPTSNLYSLNGTVWLVNTNKQAFPELSTTNSFELLALFFIVSVESIISCIISFYYTWNWRGEMTEIHLLILCSITLKAIYLYLDLSNYVTIAIAGELSKTDLYIPKFVSRIHDIAVLMLFLLIAVGWRIHRASLTTAETRLCIVISLLSIYLGIFETAVEGLQASRYILHCLTYLCALVAINFNIILLQSNLSEMDLSKQTAQTYRKVEAYIIFRIAFFAYVLKSTGLLFYKLTILSDTILQDWLLIFWDNFIDTAVFLTIAYYFRPFQNLKLFEDLNVESEVRLQNIE